MRWRFLLGIPLWKSVLLPCFFSTGCLAKRGNRTRNRSPDFLDPTTESRIIISAPWHQCLEREREGDQPLPPPSTAERMGLPIDEELAQQVLDVCARLLCRSYSAAQENQSRLLSIQ